MSEDDARAETGGISDRVAFAIASIASVAVAVGAVWFIQGPNYQTILRVRPTVSGGGVGSAWAAGNSEPLLNALMTVLHVADVAMGAFIVVMVVIHWAAFRRLADRMQPPASAAGPDAESGADVATDGGERSDGPRSSSELRSDGGTPAAADENGGDRA